jgi:predicted TIM-barrel fold metal-dependent hydrolase
VTQWLDVHHHLGPRDRITGSSEPFDLNAAIEKHLRWLDANGIVQANLIASHNATVTSQQSVRTVNELVAAAQRTHPDRFAAAVGTVDPVIGAAGLDEITYCAEDLHMPAIAWHPHFQGVFADSPSLVKYARHAASLGLVIFIHMVPQSGLEAPWRVARLATEVPEATVVCLDAFSSFDQAQWVTNEGARVGNLVFELAHLAFGSGIIARFVERYGADRLIFGSDYYEEMGAKVPVGLEVVRAAGLSAEEESAVLGGNARRLLKVRDVANWS